MRILEYFGEKDKARKYIQFGYGGMRYMYTNVKTLSYFIGQEKFI